MQNGFKSAFLVVLNLPRYRSHYNFVAFDTDMTTHFICRMLSHCIFFPPVTSPVYDHLHLKLNSLKSHAQCKLCRILGRLNFRNFLSRRNMYTAISLIFTIMRLCAYMHSQSEHLFLKINKRNGAAHVSSFHKKISLSV